VVARATRTHTVAEGATLNERDKVLFGLSEGLIRDIDTQMESLVRTYLSRWLMN